MSVQGFFQRWVKKRIAGLAIKDRLNKLPVESVLQSADPRQVRDRINEKVLEMAIRNAKATIASQGLNPSDLSEEQLEVVVNDEERKIRESFKNKTISATLALLGLQVI